MVRWADVPGRWPYQVSDTGRVRRSPDAEPCPGTRPGRELTPFAKGGEQIDGEGLYMAVTLCHQGERRHEYVHRLVAECFVGPCPGPGYHVDHMNRDRSCNVWWDLEWVPNLENNSRRHYGALLDDVGRPLGLPSIPGPLVDPLPSLFAGRAS